MKLALRTIDSIKEILTENELVALDYYVNKYPLPLDTSKAHTLKVTIDISDTDIDLYAICKLIVNSHLAFVWFDFNNLSVEADSYLYVNTDIKTKCEEKLQTFINIIYSKLIDHVMYFSVVDADDVHIEDTKYHLYLAQFADGLVLQ